MKLSPSAFCSLMNRMGSSRSPMSLLDGVLERDVVFSEYFTWESEGLLTLYLS